MNEAGIRPVLKLLAVIVDDERAENVTEVFRGARVRLHYQFRALGTASSEILDVLGLGQSEKVVILALSTQHAAYGLLKKVAHELRLMAPGRGIAFILPVSGISNLAYRFLNQDMLKHLQERIESEVEKMKTQVSYDLILTVINRGYSEELMEAARAAGASGGTVLSAHRVTVDQPLKFWGVSLQEEKDLVAIVSRREAKAEIMRAINQKCGLNSEAQGLVLALPVESVIGLDLGIDE